MKGKILIAGMIAVAASALALVRKRKRTKQPPVADYSATDASRN